MEKRRLEKDLESMIASAREPVATAPAVTETPEEQDTDGGAPFGPMDWPEDDIGREFDCYDFDFCL
jgi:hypothetical protein